MFFFFFNDTATTEIYTLSLHDALPICSNSNIGSKPLTPTAWTLAAREVAPAGAAVVEERPEARRLAETVRSEEHTSELQSPCNIVCRLLLEKKKQITCAVMLGASSWIS